MNVGVGGLNCTVLLHVTYQLSFTKKGVSADGGMWWGGGIELTVVENCCFQLHNFIAHSSFVFLFCRSLKLMSIGSVDCDVEDQLVCYMLYSMVVAFDILCLCKLVWFVVHCVN